MTTHNADNERIKRQYFTYLREARRASGATVDAVAKALHRFEAYNHFRDFKAFHPQQAIAFKRALADQTNARTGTPLSKATLHSTLSALRAFFLWLAFQPGFRSRLIGANADYFNLKENDARAAKAHTERPFPTLEQARYALDAMPSSSNIEKRDRAVVALTLLTGARDGALASLKLKHLDLVERRLIQDAREVKTKFAKTFSTYFFPVGRDVEEIVESWEIYLRTALLWSPTDPLFPATRVGIGEDQQFTALGLDRKHWSGAAPIRAIFRSAFARVGLPYYSPHSIRRTLVQLGQQRCRSAEEFKAWSQNLGHEQVMTTFSSYGQVAPTRQQELIRALGDRPASDQEAADLLEGLARRFRTQGDGRGNGRPA